MVITQQPVSDSVRSILTERGLRVRSFQELVDQLYNFQPVLDHYKRKYESLDLFQRDLYIEPSATANDGAVVSALGKFVAEWLESPQGVHLTLLGISEAGKRPSANGSLTRYRRNNSARGGFHCLFD